MSKWPVLGAQFPLLGNVQWAKLHLSECFALVSAELCPIEGYTSGQDHRPQDMHTIPEYDHACCLQISFIKFSPRFSFCLKLRPHAYLAPKLKLVLANFTLEQVKVTTNTTPFSHAMSDNAGVKFAYKLTRNQNSTPDLNPTLLLVDKNDAHFLLLCTSERTNDQGITGGVVSFLSCLYPPPQTKVRPRAWKPTPAFPCTAPTSPSALLNNSLGEHPTNCHSLQGLMYVLFALFVLGRQGVFCIPKVTHDRRTEDVFGPTHPETVMWLLTSA